MSSPYLFYTEYYLISGAYHIINIVNGILTYSACYSDNMKEYLRNQVASKQVVLNELIRNENNARTSVNQNDNDIDEDGFVVIKMKRQKKNKNEYYHSNGINCSTNGINCSTNSDIIEQVVEEIIKNVIINN